MNKPRHPFLCLALVLISGFTFHLSDQSAQGQSSRRYLAADATQRYELQNIQITNHQAQHVGQAFELDQPWEQDLRVNYPGATVWDAENNEYRMYYEVVLGGEFASSGPTNRHLALATSSDGINWVKPALNITGNANSNSPQNNFIAIAGTTHAQGATVFIDPTAPAEQRYKISYRDFEQSNGLSLITGVSADGLNFQPVGLIDDLTDQGRGLDSQNVAFWDPISNEFKSYSRYWFGFLRGVALRRNDSWEGDWNAPRELILDPAEFYNDDGGTQFYTPGISTYHGQYIGIPSLYHDRDNDGRINSGLLHSVDGENWLPVGSEDFIDVSVHSPAGVDDFQIYAQPTIVEKNGELLFYYTYFDENHEADDSVFINLEYQSELHIAKLRRDGFTSLDSVGTETATWLTDVISLDSDACFVELNAIVNGSLSAEILDAQTMEVIDGFSLTESSVLSAGDFLDARLEWTGGRTLAELNDRDVRFKFLFEDSSIFSFSVATDIELLFGDVNLDGVVSFLDISPFISILSSADFQKEADINQDNEVSFLDIAPFISILSGN